MFHTRTLNPKSLLLKIVLSLLSASCHNKFPLQGYNVSGSSTPFSEISQSLGYLWMPTYSLELEEKNTFFTYVSFLQFWRDWIFVRFWGLILVVCILLWLFLIPFLEKTLVCILPRFSFGWFCQRTANNHAKQWKHGSRCL